MSVATDHTYLTVAEAAHELRVSPQTIRRLIRSGDLLGLRVGPKSIRIPVESVAKLPRSVREEIAR